jgi:transcriptional regulator with XRE-family HTH domain
VTSNQDSPRELRLTGDAHRHGVGPDLAKLRKQRRLTGVALAKIVGISQSKISKIEVGTIIPSPEDVERLARALDASDDQVTALVERVEGQHQELVDVRFSGRRMISGQQELASLESRARAVRVFQPAVVPGLLQTTGYAQAILSDYAGVFVEVFGGRDREDERPVRPAVTARVARQEVLGGVGRTFHLLMMETVFMNRVCSPAQMLAQLDHIRQVAAEYSAVTIGIVPTDTQLAYPPLHGFHLLDDRNLMIDLANTSVASRGSEVLRIYRTVFDYFAEQATTAIDPILDRYTEIYARLTLPS